MLYEVLAFGCATLAVLDASLEDLAISKLGKFRFGLHLDLTMLRRSVHFHKPLRVVQEMSPSSALPTTLPIHLFRTFAEVSHMQYLICSGYVNNLLPSR